MKIDLVKLFTRQKVALNHPDRRVKATRMREVTRPKITFRTSPIFDNFVLPTREYFSTYEYVDGDFAYKMVFCYNTELLLPTDILQTSFAGPWSAILRRYVEREQITYGSRKRFRCKTHWKLTLFLSNAEDYILLKMHGIISSGNLYTERVYEND